MKPAHLQWRSLATLGLAAVLGACTEATGGVEDTVQVLVSKVETILPEGAPVISYRLENRGGRPIFVVACGELLVAEIEQRRTSGSAWIPAEAAVGCPADLLYLAVAVDERTSGKGSITAPGAGTYRLVVRYRVGTAQGQSEAAVSAPIEVPTR